MVVKGPLLNLERMFYFFFFFSCFLINFGSALVFWPFLFYFVVRFTITGIAVY